MVQGMLSGLCSRFYQRQCLHFLFVYTLATLMIYPSVVQSYAIRRLNQAALLTDRALLNVFHRELEHQLATPDERVMTAQLNVPVRVTQDPEKNPESGHLVLSVDPDDVISGVRDDPDLYSFTTINNIDKYINGGDGMAPRQRLDELMKGDGDLSDDDIPVLGNHAYEKPGIQQNYPIQPQLEGVLKMPSLESKLLLSRGGASPQLQESSRLDPPHSQKSRNMMFAKRGISHSRVRTILNSVPANRLKQLLSQMGSRGTGRASRPGNGNDDMGEPDLSINLDLDVLSYMMKANTRNSANSSSRDRLENLG